MRDHNDKIARAAHIKPRTAGTSNEISFSVLHAASQGVDNTPTGRATRGRSGESPDQLDADFDVSRETSDDYIFRQSLPSVKAPKESASKTASFEPSLPIYSDPRLSSSHTNIPSAFNGNSSAGMQMPDLDEIARRKKHRKRSRILVGAAFAVACVVVVLGIAWVWHSQVSAQQSYESKLVEALRQIDESDEVVMAIDDLVNEPFSDDNQTKRKTVSSGISDAKERLKAAEDQAKEASSGLNDGLAKQAASEAISSIDARLSMLDSGQMLLKASQDAIDGTAAYNQAWDRVLAADDIVREAAKLTSSSETEESKAKYEEALATFEDARTKLANVQTKYQQVDLTDVLTYVDKRIEAMGYAIASDEALIAKEKEEAVTQNDNYNNTETEAATSALNLPAHPEQLYRSAYSNNTSETLKTYRAARSQAGTSDTVIREYLGAEGK